MTRKLLLAVVLGCWALPAWGQVVDRVLPPDYDDTELTGETTAENLHVTEDFLWDERPVGIHIGRDVAGVTESAAEGSDIALPAPIVVYNTDGSETYFGSFTNTSDQNGDELESAFPLGAGKSMKLAPVSFTSIAADLLVSNNCTVDGSGGGTFVQLDGELTTSVVSVFANAAGASGNSGIRIANMTIDGNNVENTDTSKKQNGVNLVACDGCVVEGIRAQHFGRAGTDSCIGVRLAGCSDTRILNNTFIDVVDGVNTLLSGATFCKRLTIANNTVESTCRDYGFTIYQIEDSVIANNVAAECQKNGIYLSWATDCLVIGNSVSNCGRGAAATYGGIALGLFSPTNNTIIGNQVRTAPSGNQQSYGITIASGANYTFLDGNDFANSGVTGAILDSSTTTIHGTNAIADGVIDAVKSRNTLGATAGVWPASTGGTGLSALAANVVSILSAADYSAIRTLLALVPGTNVQAFDADLDDLADGSLTGSKVGGAITGTTVVPTTRLGVIDLTTSSPGWKRQSGLGTARWLACLGDGTGLSSIGTNGFDVFASTAQEAAGNRTANLGDSGSGSSLKMASTGFISMGSSSTDIGSQDTGLRRGAAGLWDVDSGTAGQPRDVRLRNLYHIERATDPADPAEGQSTVWQSDGTGAGDDGDIMVKITAGGVTKTITLIDFSAF